jgi:hypothetical protein
MLSGPRRWEVGDKAIRWWQKGTKRKKERAFIARDWVVHSSLLEFAFGDLSGNSTLPVLGGLVP